MSDLRYWIALSMLQDIGPVGSRKLLSAFVTPERIFDAGTDALLCVEGIGVNRAKNIKEFSLWEDVEKRITAMEKKGVKAVSFDKPSYPEMLREIEDAPVVIYARGDIQPQDRYAIAIVGSRKPTPYGTSVAEYISEELASMGFTIVSGMARGIDAISHKGALRAGGRTMAVLGSGLDVPYPPENKGLMDKIASSGCVISEFPLGTPPDKENFPKRNRLISGLSFGVLVVEATSDSGSLITAGCAIEQGREVFAVPGNITSSASDGTNKLIRKGAVLTRKAEDIVKELAPVLKGFIRSKEKAKIEITDEEKNLYNLLSGEPIHIDVISRESGLPASKALGILLGLELKGAVKQTTGKRFYLA
ncbi:MAG: DNA protecting protein DprA [Thermodesulfovibrio sp. RBG_19FT_COMBO_42_12]|nr:MAG: DNA protecting protein DprA [Thermodesulfovibrio sp. RBG_19FT_COMBO_42_12]